MLTQQYQRQSGPPPLPCRKPLHLKNPAPARHPFGAVSVGGNRLQSRGSAALHCPLRMPAPLGRVENLYTSGNPRPQQGLPRGRAGI